MQAQGLWHAVEPEEDGIEYREDRLVFTTIQRMQWEFLQTKIGNWNQFMQIAVRVLFKV
jgi:hypothetical protein